MALISFSFVLQALPVVPNCLPRGSIEIPESSKQQPISRRTCIYFCPFDQPHHGPRVRPHGDIRMKTNVQCKFIHFDPVVLVNPLAIFFSALRASFDMSVSSAALFGEVVVVPPRYSIFSLFGYPTNWTGYITRVM